MVDGKMQAEKIPAGSGAGPMPRRALDWTMRVWRPAGTVLAGLLVAEMVATRGKSLGAQLQELFAQVGSFYPVRENFRLTPERKAAFTEKLKTDPTELSGRKVVSVVRTDGLKLILDDGSWVCYRLSGTEPVVRAYTETRREQDKEALKAAAEKFVLS